MSDLIDRQAAINEVMRVGKAVPTFAIRAKDALKELPTAQPEIIRCKDCRWWDKYADYDKGYCMAAKHDYWSGHWGISIRRKYEGNFYCADAERKNDE